jgi:hypothetical protein
VHVGPVQPVEAVVGVDVRARLQADEGTEARGMLQRKMQHDATADRAAHHDGTIEAERVDNGQDGVDVGARGQLVL